MEEEHQRFQKTLLNAFRLSFIPLFDSEAVYLVSADQGKYDTWRTQKYVAGVNDPTKVHIVSAVEATWHYGPGAEDYTEEKYGGPCLMAALVCETPPGFRPSAFSTGLINGSGTVRSFTHARDLASDVMESDVPMETAKLVVRVPTAFIVDESISYGPFAAFYDGVIGDPRVAGISGTSFSFGGGTYNTAVSEHTWLGGFSGEPDTKFKY